MSIHTSIFVYYSYFTILALLGIFGIHRLCLVFKYYRLRKLKPEPLRQFETLPRLTVQLPIYNESEVVERLIDCIVLLDYPKELLEIQVLDDSTDQTSEIIKLACLTYTAQGIDISHIKRSSRDGFKGGALAHGLSLAKGEFIAVFDADFLPKADFLKRTVHFFTDQRVSMVQMKWAYLNDKSSILTRAQSVLLDGHFQIEHTARNRSGLFFNFNGTAGIWRRESIEQAGGWQGDTLTEDLDLSYRAQLAGAKFVYLVDDEAPSELPLSIEAFKSQQHRWTAGSIQVLRKLLRRICASDIQFRVKIESLFHLGANFCHILVLILGLLLLPMVEARQVLLTKVFNAKLFDSFILSIGLSSVFIFYAVARRESRKVSWPRAILEVPLGLLVGIGLSLSNTCAVIEGLSNFRGSFNRTPKTGRCNTGQYNTGQYNTGRDNTGRDNSVLPNDYFNNISSLSAPGRNGRKFWRTWLIFGELILFLYFTVVIIRVVELKLFGALPFVLLFWLSFGYYVCLGAREQIMGRLSGLIWPAAFSVRSANVSTAQES